MRLTITAVISAMLMLCGSLFAHAAAVGFPKNLIYKGGPVLSGEVKAYFIFYGTWKDEHKDLLMDFIDNLGFTSWFNTLRLYTDSLGNSVTGPLKFTAAMNDLKSHGDSLQGNSSHVDIITKAVETGYLGNGIDHSGVYFILAGEDVDDVGLCTDWCAYNSYTDDFVDPSKNRCIPYLNNQVSPNGDPALDAIVGMIAHELPEMLTDPLGNGWQVSNEAPNSRYTEEIADWCMPPNATPDEWFPNVTKLENGASWNLQVGSAKWLIQSMWNPVTNQCTMAS
ncbi:hypothetical protein BC937DRAFT_94756 [Endogone sp. FLAS-F59071]|nr:hypothetical protein BC937DRAFT_94756 [Endogone sp. FLAS-F59071]|eukprot:RUS13800.1 hypothetical protein BC937DRAFT_94756 [Endogone sp. FLAS-F59071]